MIKNAILLLLAASILGGVANFVSPNKIDFVGEYRQLSGGDGPIIPPSAEEGDPPFIDISVAQMEHSAGKILFIDARDESEFNCGTIPGAINVPFDYLPEDDDLTPYLDSALGVDRDYPLIVFCSGEECDLSLQMGRLLQDYDYKTISIFFGGAREWETFGLETERREQCDE